MAKYSYPQNVFGKSIVSELKEKKNISTIVDAPCGNGQTTYDLSKIKHCNTFGYDISQKCIDNAKEFFFKENLRYEMCDIFQVFGKHQKIDVFCLINSLFLLPQQDLLLKNIHEIINDDGCLMLILPNIEGKNYRNFLLKDKKNININTLLLNSSQFTDYFAERNFKIKKMKGIVYTHFYNRFDVKLFSVFSHFYLSFLNIIQSFFKIDSPSYFLLELTKGDVNK